jgi:hypothetical protein
MAWDDAPTCRPELCGGTFHDILDSAIMRAADAGHGAEEEVYGSSRDQPLNDRERIRKRRCWKLQHASAAGLAAAGVASRQASEGCPRLRELHRAGALASQMSDGTLR